MTWFCDWNDLAFFKFPQIPRLLKSCIIYSIAMNLAVLAIAKILITVTYLFISLAVKLSILVVACIEHPIIVNHDSKTIWNLVFREANVLSSVFKFNLLNKVLFFNQRGQYIIETLRLRFNKIRSQLIAFVIVNYLGWGSSIIVDVLLGLGCWWNNWILLKVLFNFFIHDEGNSFQKGEVIGKIAKINDSLGGKVHTNTLHFVCFCLTKIQGIFKLNRGNIHDNFINN